MGVGVNVALNIILSRIMGLNGVPLATSCANITQTALLFVCLHKYIKGLAWREIAEDFLKCGLSTACMLFVSHKVYVGLSSGAMPVILAFLLATAIAFVIYFIVGIMLRQHGTVQVLDYLKALLYKMIRRVDG